MTGACAEVGTGGRVVFLIGVNLILGVVLIISTIKRHIHFKYIFLGGNEVPPITPLITKGIVDYNKQ